MVRLITWNVAGRSRRLPEQAAALAAPEPDIVALQEVTRRTEALWKRAFALMGLRHVSVSALGPGPTGGRRTLVMIAARGVLEEVQPRRAVPRPESALSVVVRSRAGPLEIHCLHVPNAANGWVKVETLQALRRGL